MKSEGFYKNRSDSGKKVCELFTIKTNIKRKNNCRERENVRKTKGKQRVCDSEMLWE